MNRIITLALCFIFGCIVSAQRGVIRYTQEAGLISNSVNDIAYDELGFLWIATDKGIERFDGQRFLHFRHDPDDPTTICSDRVLRVYFDPNGFIWGATLRGGLIRIQIQTFAIRNFVHQQRVVGSVSDNYITEIMSDRIGQMWFSPYQRGLDLFNARKNKFTNFRPSSEHRELDPTKSDEFSAVVTDRNNANFLWCASKAGLFLFNKQLKSWSYYPIRNDRLMEKDQLNGLEADMRCIETDGKGNLYIGSAGGGLLYFDKYQGLYRTFKTQTNKEINVDNNTFTAIKWRDSRYLYVCSPKSEFQLFDTKRKVFISYNENEQIIKGSQRIARFGSQIAVAGSESGIYIHNESIIFGKRVRYPFHFQTMAFSNQDNSWIAIDGTEHCFIKKNRLQPTIIRMTSSNGGQFYPEKITFFNNYGYVLISKTGIATVNMEGKLNLLVDFRDRKTKKIVELTSPIAYFNDGDTVIWLGTKSAGILRYSLTTKRLKFFKRGVGKNQELHHRHTNISCFSKYKNLLFFGCNEGIGCIDLKRRIVIPTLISSAVPRDQVKSMVTDRFGHLWIGTLANGLHVLDVKSGRNRRVFVSRDGLQNQQVDALKKTKIYIWVQTANGISVINSANYAIQSIENQHGIDQINDIVVHSNKLYFLKDAGYVEVTNASGLPRRNQPKPYIQRVHTLNGEVFKENRTVFDYFENNISFEFGVLDFSTSANNFVTYRLKGLETAWRSGNGRDEADYFNLPGGEYVFQVRVMENGVSSIKEYPLRITPPFWVNWWFIGLVFVVSISLVWWYLRSRIQRVKTNERMRSDFNRQINEMESKALRAQMNPHFLFNSLNSIRLFILKNESENASDYIAKFSKLLRMILNHSRQDMIQVFDEIQSLKLYLEFERLRFDQGFDFDIQIDGQQVLDCLLPPMIVQPFVENAIWHGLMPRNDGSGYIQIKFIREPHRLLITVEDNGIGRKSAAEINKKTALKEGSVGLQITKDRLRSLTKRTRRLNDYMVEDLMDEAGNPKGTLIRLYFEISDSKITGQNNTND